MEVQLETPSTGGKEGGLLRQLRVKIPAQEVDRAYDARIKSIAGRARIPGFRPGKAPMQVVQKQYGAAARSEVLEDLVRSSYPEAVDKAGVNPATSPSFELGAQVAGQPFEYLARFEVYPEIKLKPLDKLQVDKPAVDVTEADVDRLLASLRRNRRTLEDVDRACQDGDVIHIDFVGSIDGKEFAGGKGENVEVEVGSGRFLPDLDKSFAGRKPGDTYNQDVSFPKDYQAEELQGKTAQFAVTVKSVKEPKLPEIDAEFLKAHGVAGDAGEAGLRAKLKSALEAERDKAIRAKLKQQVMDQLLEHNPIDVPRGVLSRELERVREEAAARFNAAKLKPEQQKQLLPDEMLMPTAKRRVSLGLLVGEVLKEKKITLDETRLDRALDEMAAEYEKPEQVKQFYRSRNDLMQGVRALVLEEQVVEAMLAEAKARDTKMTLDELLQPQQDNPGHGRPGHVHGPDCDHDHDH